jgi:uncharacterized membrane protein YfcA
VLAFGFQPATAVGTDLLYAAATKSGGTVVHALHRTVAWRVVARLAAGSVPATVVTIYTLHHFDAHSAEMSSLISRVLGVALILSSVSVVYRRLILRVARAISFHARPRLRLVVTVGMGALLGVLVSLSSVGAGAIGVTALIMLYPAMPTVRVVGTDIAHAVPLALVAGFGHWLIGSVNWAVLISLLIGSLPGIVLASRLAPRMPDGFLRPILAGVLALVGLKLVFF